MAKLPFLPPGPAPSPGRRSASALECDRRWWAGTERVDRVPDPSRSDRASPLTAACTPQVFAQARRHACAPTP